MDALKAERGEDYPIRGSLVKQAIKRQNPGFNERAHGFRAFNELLLAHKDRTRVLPDEYRKTVIHKNGDVQQTFLVDGVVAGLWKRDGDRITLEPFAPLPRAAQRELEDEAARLHAWLG